MGRDDHDPNRLSVLEVRGVFDEMDGAQWKRAERLARFIARGTVGMDGEDLLAEACTQLLSGQRRFPRGRHPLVVLKTAMRSLASNVRKSAWMARKDEGYGTGPGVASDDSDEAHNSRPLAPGAVDQITPEDEALAKEHLDAVTAAVTEDPDAELVLMAWAEGMRGADAMKATGLDEKAYDAARKRLLRLLAPLTPEERKS